MSRETHSMLCLRNLFSETALERQLMVENDRLRAELLRRDERIAALEKRVAELEMLLAKALRNSSTSSKPPSSDIVKPPKPPSCAPGQTRKPGGQPGHIKHSRLPFDAASVTGVHPYTLEACPDCRGPVALLPAKARVVQQVEMAPAPVQIIDEHRGLAYWCARCGKVHYAPLPSAVEKGGLIGPILTAQIAYMKGALHPKNGG